MPNISVFFGIYIYIYYFDKGSHHYPHIHARYGEYEAAFAIMTGGMLAGNFPDNRTRLVQAWIEIHRDELKQNWDFASTGKPVFKIDPLR